VVFRKTARVEVLASCTVEPSSGMLKVAQQDGTNPVSYYLDGARKIDVRGQLEKVAEEFSISADPSDYIFEVIRANTTNVPNENNDGFHRSELLRFDTRIRAPVYMTYVAKPHHVNHRTENPKAARGCILDSHYNDSTPALSHCPNEKCFTDGERTKTADVKNRDESGIHCKKCGSTCKDEFVEVLVAVDTKKDPLFAKGVRTGVLRASSMGCNCLSTVCNVCSHVAYSKPEFCVHIKAGNKGSLWKKEGQNWIKINAAEAEAELSKGGSSFVGQDFCYAKADDGFEIRKAFEYCLGVIFDELSRVDQPADPKALQREILKAAQLVGMNLSEDDLKRETEMLIHMAEIRRLQAQQQHHRAASKKVAGKFYVVRVNGEADDTHAAESLEEALDTAMPDEGSTVEYCEVEADDAGAARLMWDEASAKPAPMDQDGAVFLEIPDELQDMTLALEPPPEGMAPPGIEEMPPEGVPPEGAPGSIEQFAPGGPPGAPPSGEEEPLSPAELGVMPPGASSPRKTSQRRRSVMRPFAASYRDWTVKITPHGNACVLDGAKQPVFVVRAQKKLAGVAQRRSFGQQVLAHLFEHGIVPTMKAFTVHLSPKIAQVVDGAIDDMQGFEDKYMHSSVLEGADKQDDMDGSQRGTPPAEIGGAGSDQDDMAGDVRGTPPGGAVEDGTVDHELGREQQVDTAVGEQEDDMQGKVRKPVSVGQDSVLDDEIHDHKEKLAALRVGARVAQRGKNDKPGRPWVIAKRQRDPKNKDKAIFTVRRGQKRASVGSDDLLTRWLVLDKGPATVKLPGRPQQRVEAMGKSAKECPKCEHDPCTCGEKEARQRFEARLKKAHATKVAQLEEAHATKVAEVEATFLNRLARAAFFVDHRQRMNVEASGIKQAMVRVLTADREVGQDQSTGEPLVYQGMDAALAHHLVETAFMEDSGEHVESLFTRAAEVMQYGDEYLLTAEKDLQNLQHVARPIEASHQLEGGDPAEREAEAVRQAARAGNPHINPAPDPEVGNGHNKRASIRSALGGHSIESARGQMRN
jgi:hypothetical protein